MFESYNGNDENENNSQAFIVALWLANNIDPKILDKAPSYVRGWIGIHNKTDKVG